MGLIIAGVLSYCLVIRLPDPEVQLPSGATRTSPPARTSKELVHPDHPVVITVPDRWKRSTGLVAPVLLLATEPETGNNLGLIGLRMANKNFSLNRKNAENSLLKDASPTCKILHRLDTKVLGLPAYCLIAQTELQGTKMSLARIMTEKPLNGFVYVVQFSKLSPGNLSPESVPSIVNRVKLKE